MVTIAQALQQTQQAEQTAFKAEQQISAQEKQVEAIKIPTRTIASQLQYRGGLTAAIMGAKTAKAKGLSQVTAARKGLTEFKGKVSTYKQQIKEAQERKASYESKVSEFRKEQQAWSFARKIAGREKLPSWYTSLSKTMKRRISKIRREPTAPSKPPVYLSESSSIFKEGAPLGIRVEGLGLMSVAQPTKKPFTSFEPTGKEFLPPAVFEATKFKAPEVKPLALPPPSVSAIRPSTFWEKRVPSKVKGAYLQLAGGGEELISLYGALDYKPDTTPYFAPTIITTAPTGVGTTGIFKPPTPAERTLEQRYSSEITGIGITTSIKLDKLFERLTSKYQKQVTAGDVSVSKATKGLELEYERESALIQKQYKEKTKAQEKIYKKSVLITTLPLTAAKGVTFGILAAVAPPVGYAIGGLGLGKLGFERKETSEMFRKYPKESLLHLGAGFGGVLAGGLAVRGIGGGIFGFKGGKIIKPLRFKKGKLPKIRGRRLDIFGKPTRLPGARKLALRRLKEARKAEELKGFTFEQFRRREFVSKFPKIRKELELRLKVPGAGKLALRRLKAARKAEELKGFTFKQFRRREFISKLPKIRRELELRLRVPGVRKLAIKKARAESFRQFGLRELSKRRRATEVGKIFKLKPKFKKYPGDIIPKKGFDIQGTSIWGRGAFGKRLRQPRIEILKGLSKFQRKLTIYHEKGHLFFRTLKAKAKLKRLPKVQRERLFKLAKRELKTEGVWKQYQKTKVIEELLVRRFARRALLEKQLRQQPIHRLALKRVKKITLTAKGREFRLKMLERKPAELIKPLERDWIKGQIKATLRTQPERLIPGARQRTLQLLKPTKEIVKQPKVVRITDVFKPTKLQKLALKRLRQPEPKPIFDFQLRRLVPKVSKRERLGVGYPIIVGGLGARGAYAGRGLYERTGVRQVLVQKQALKIEEQFKVQTPSLKFRQQLRTAELFAEPRQGFGVRPAIALFPKQRQPQFVAQFPGQISRRALTQRQRVGVAQPFPYPQAPALRQTIASALGLRQKAVTVSLFVPPPKTVTTLLIPRAPIRRVRKPRELAGKIRQPFRYQPSLSAGVFGIYAKKKPKPVGTGFFLTYLPGIRPIIRKKKGL